MPLREDMPIRDNERADDKHARAYNPNAGGWTRDVNDDRPVPGTPNGTNGRLR